MVPVVLALLLALAPAGPVGATAATGREEAASPAATAWVLPSAPSALVRRHAGALDQLDVVGVSLRPGGAALTRVPRGSRRLLRVARRAGLRVELLVNNYSNREGGFDARAAHRLLSEPARVRRVARRLAGLVTGQGWDGVNVDLELVRRTDAGGLALLVEQLQVRLPPAATVSVDVSAATSLRGYRRHGYLLGRLAAAADVVAVMTYDHAGPTWSGPGPVQPLAWQRAAVAAALRRVPADRLDLGVAGYGYTWPSRRSGRVGRSVTVPQARRMVRRDGARPRWHPGPGEWSARLSDGTRLWWSDRRSYRLRRGLASELGVRGTALWRLGSIDTLSR